MGFGWRALVCTALLAAAYQAAAPGGQLQLRPASWAVLSIVVWLLYITVCGRSHMGVWDQRHFVWGLFSAIILLDFLHFDRDFKGWGDVYFFCGRRLQYCTCDFRWNLNGWTKAAVLWNFVLSAALGVQKLAIQLGLGGLLPGEEVVTKESFISICWRLIPYWLNNWEQQWGAECSSMMFELPHFAIELLVVLPCVQIICARLKILALPQLRVVAPRHLVPGLQAAPDAARQDLAPNVLRGFWEIAPAQRSLMRRLRSNLRVMAITVAVGALATANALVVPLYLERQIAYHDRTPATLAAAAALNFTAPERSASGWQWLLDLAGKSSGRLATPEAAQLLVLREGYQAKGCENMDRLQLNMRKHALEINKMQDPTHAALIPLVEAALAVMRLACEKFFVLVAVYAAYLLWREPPRGVRAAIRATARLSTLFQRLILYSFPGICWAYGAGFVFSSFVSIVFWGAPALRLVEATRRAATLVRPRALTDADESHLERMGGNCAICWTEMVAAGSVTSHGSVQPGEPASRLLGKALACSHAYHEGCILQWLAQCHASGRAPTCPMCQATIELEVRYRLPLPWRQAGEADALALVGQAGAAQEPGLQAQHDFQALIGDLGGVPLALPAVAAGPAGLAGQRAAQPAPAPRAPPAHAPAAGPGPPGAAADLAAAPQPSRGSSRGAQSPTAQHARLPPLPATCRPSCSEAGLEAGCSSQPAQPPDTAAPAGTAPRPADSAGGLLARLQGRRAGAARSNPGVRQRHIVDGACMPAECPGPPAGPAG